MANKGVNIKISSDVKGAEDGIAKVTKRLNELSKNKAIKTLNRLSGAMTLAKGAFSAASAAVGKAIDVMKDLARGGRFDTM